jgi:hypothetical protein
MLAGPSWRVVSIMPIAFRSGSEEHYDERSARSVSLCDGALNNHLSLPAIASEKKDAAGRANPAGRLRGLRIARR